MSQKSFSRNRPEHNQETRYLRINHSTICYNLRLTEGVFNFTARKPFIEGDPLACQLNILGGVLFHDAMGPQWGAYSMMHGVRLSQPCGQTDNTENISFPQICLQKVPNTKFLTSIQIQTILAHRTTLLHRARKDTTRSVTT